MASPASPEASEVRRRGQRRLIGAIAIVALLVVFVPMLLDSEPRPSTPSVDTRIPPREKAAPLPAPVPPSPAMQAATPRPGKPAEEPAKAPAVDPAPAAAQEATRAATEAQHALVEPVAAVKKAEVLKAAAEPKAAAKVEAKPEPAKAEAKAASKAEPPKSEAKGGPKLEGFALQVGAFRDEEKLKSAREKLAAAGVVHYTERLDSANGPITRLRAGPFPTRAAAEAAAGKLKAVAPDAKVVPLP